MSGRLRQLESYLDARPELKGKLLKRLSALLSVPVAAGVGMYRTGEF